MGVCVSLNHKVLEISSLYKIKMIDLAALLFY